VGWKWREPSLPISTEVTTNDAGPLRAGRSGRFRSDEKQILHTAGKVRERFRDDKLSESSRRRGRPAVTGGMSEEKVGNLRELYERTGEIVA